MSKIKKSEIIRRPDFAGGGITAEEKTRLDAHAQKWIKRIMRTEPINATAITRAIEALYEAANLARPRVVVVPSPLIMVVAGGLASAIWATRGATDVTVRKATDEAAYDATVRDAIDARVAATEGTYIAAHAAVQAATEATEATYVIDTICENYGLDKKTAVNAVRKWTSCYQGGNMWSQYDSFLTAARDVLGLRLPEHAAYAAWEQCAIEGGFRYMHRRFCLVSDFPETLRVNAAYRPHSYDGPSHRWRDGWSLYHFHGVRVPEYYAVTPAEKIDPRKVMAERNVEVRRAIIGKVGLVRLLGNLQTKVISTAPNGERLLEIVLDGDTKIRGLHCIWEEGDGLHETILGVGWERRHFGTDCPDDIDDAEQVRRWTLRLPKEANIVAES